MSGLIFFEGAVEPASPDRQAVSQLWQRGLTASEIASRLKVPVEAVAKVLAEAESGRD